MTPDTDGRADRELLELAARAIGEQVVGDNEGGLLLYGVEHPWNPLTDDGDALRLAVKLTLNVYPMDMPGWAAAADGGDVYAKECTEDDPYAATRRAIVRAAAEIGRTT